MAINKNSNDEQVTIDDLVSHKWDITQKCSVCGLENSLNYGEFTTWDDYWNRVYSQCPGNPNEIVLSNGKKVDLEEFHEYLDFCEDW